MIWFIRLTYSGGRLVNTLFNNIEWRQLGQREHKKKNESIATAKSHISYLCYGMLFETKKALIEWLTHDVWLLSQQKLVNSKHDASMQ